MMNNLLADKKTRLRNKGRSMGRKKHKYPGHMKLMQDLKSVRAKIEVKNQK